jgi:hypothetical protein
MTEQEVLVFWENTDDNDLTAEYDIIYDLDRTDITAVVELVAVERLHEGVKKDKVGYLYHPNWPGYEPSNYPRAYRVDRKEHIDMLSTMFDLEIDLI